MRPSAVRRSLYCLASLVTLWALIAELTGGVGTNIGPLRISSRAPWRPALVGLALWAYYLWRYDREERGPDAVWLEAVLKRTLPIVAVAAVAIGFGVGVRYGSFAAAGSDSYGDVSQAYPPGLPIIMAVATIASMLMVASPTFLTHVMVPISDVPAAAGNGHAGRLDWDPVARVHDAPQVRLYDLAGRGAASMP